MRLQILHRSLFLLFQICAWKVSKCGKFTNIIFWVLVGEASLPLFPSIPFSILPPRTNLMPPLWFDEPWKWLPPTTSGLISCLSPLLPSSPLSDCLPSPLAWSSREKFVPRLSDLQVNCRSQGKPMGHLLCTQFGRGVQKVRKKAWSWKLATENNGEQTFSSIWVSIQTRSAISAWRLERDFPQTVQLFPCSLLAGHSAPNLIWWTYFLDPRKTLEIIVLSFSIYFSVLKDNAINIWYTFWRS